MFQVICQAKYDQITNRTVIVWPLNIAGGLYEFFRKGAEKHNGYYRVKMQYPARPRTTGPHSQNRHINGHCQQIAIETGNDFEVVKMAVKTAAISAGYGFQTLPDGSVWPISEADATTEQAAILIATIHRFAAEWEINLVEDDNEIQ